MEENEKDPNIEIAIRYIQDNFSPLGVEPEYITSADIVRDLSEMASLSIADITQLMDKARFKIKFIEGKPFWIVYLK